MSRWERFHGAALVASAACIPVGEGLTFISLFAVAGAMLARRRAVRGDDLRRGPLAEMLAGFGVWLVSGLVAVALCGQWLKPGELGRWLPLAAIPLIVVSARMLPRVWLERAAWAFVCSLAAAAAFGLCQYYFNVRPGEALTRVDISIASQARVPGAFARSAASGFYFHRLKLAHVLLVGIGGLLAHQLFGAPRWPQRLLSAAGLFLFTAALFLTFARGAFLGAAVASTALLALAPWRWRLATCLTAALAVALAWSFPAVRERVVSSAGSEASAIRALIWSQGVRIIADAPLGAGLGNYSRLVGGYYDTVEPSFVTRTYPHNIVLAAWAETGPAGLLGYVWAWLALGVACVARLRAQRPGWVAVLAGAGLFGTVALWTVGITHDVLYHNAVALAYCGLAGLVLGALVTEPPVVQPRPSRLGIRVSL